MDISHCVKMTCVLYRKPIFSLRALLNIVSRSFSKKLRLKKFQVFDENHGLTPFAKWTFFNYDEMTIFVYNNFTCYVDLFG